MIIQERNKHDASGQLAGYLYQVLAALLLLLKNTDPEAQICVERFDDVTIIEDDVPVTQIQIKHHIKNGILIDTSVELWRTINSWCSSIKTCQASTKKTDFVIITTSCAKNGTAASYLKQTGRDWTKAKNILQSTASGKAVKANQKFYSAYLSLNEKEQENLVKNIYIFDNALSITNIENDIIHYIRTATLPAFEERVYEKILGWWIRIIIDCLTSETPVFIGYRQLQSKLYDVSSEYKADSLPIDVDPLYQPTDKELDALSSENRIFIKQLNLIALSSDRLKRCIRDYYNAYRQRSLWVRENLLFIDDLTKYETDLFDEWNRLFLVMKEDMLDYGDRITENQKCAQGRKLFGKIEELHLPLKKNVTQPFIMRGTYHELANQLKIGWHIDFLDRLCQLLRG